MRGEYVKGKVKVSNDGTTSDGSKGKLTLTQGTITGDVTISDATATVAVDGGTIQGKITNQSTNFTVSSSATLSSTENNLGVAYITKDGKTTYYQTMAAAVEAAGTGDTIFATADKENDLPADYAYTKVTVDDKEVYKVIYVASVAVTNDTTTQYYSLSEVFAAASGVKNEANITLLADVKVDTKINVAKVSGGVYVGLSLNGKTITSTADNTFNVTSGTFRIKSAGTITQSTAGSVIKVSNGARLWANNFAYTIENTASNNTAYVIDVSGSGTKADFEGSGTISGAYGVKVSDGAIVTVKGNTTIDATNSNTGNAVGVLVGGGELTVGATGATTNPIIKASGGAKNVGILQAGGTLNVNNGTITGGNEAVEDDASTTDVNEAKELVAGTGVEVHAGTFNFDGGTITGYGTSFVDSGNSDSNGTAPLISGAGIAISQLDASKSLTVNAAKDTNASGFVALAVTNPKSLTETTTVPSVMGSGGTFQSTGSGTGSWDSTNKQLTSRQYAFLNTDTRITVNLSGSIVTHPDATEDTNKTIKETDTLKLSDGKYPGYTDTDNGTAFTIPTIMYTQGGKEVYSNETLAEAVNKADANTIIHLYADKSGNGFTINKNLTIDFGGYTYTITKPTGDGAAELSHIIAALGTTVTFQNGTVNAEENSTLSTLIESKTSSCTFSNITLDGANLKGTDAYALTNNYKVQFNSGTVINPISDGTTKSTVGSIRIISHVDSYTYTYNSDVTINGNIFVSGNTNWNSARIKLHPPINGDLLLDKEAAEGDALSKIKLEPRMNTVTAEDRMFSDNSFIVGDGTTVYPSDKLIAYKLNSTDSLYHVGKGDGWITLASGEGAASVVNWVHIAPSLEGSRISAAVTKFSGLSTVEQDTSVALDTVNGVAGINAAVTLATTTTGTSDDTVKTTLIPTATLVSNESTTLNVAQVLFDNKKNPTVASITTYVDAVTITDSIYGSSVTAVTAAGITDSTIGIYIAGNDKVTSIVGGDG